MGSSKECYMIRVKEEIRCHEIVNILAVCIQGRIESSASEWTKLGLVRHR